jgi:hypothetical protein
MAMLLLLAAQQATLVTGAPRFTASPTASVIWRGTMSYPCTSDCGGAKWLVHEGPIIITEVNAVASTDWTWTVLPVPGHAPAYCVPKHEVGLAVQTPAAGAAGRWYARGSSSRTSFYSLEATLSADGRTLSDGVIYFGGNQSAGTFAARRDAPRANSTCMPPPPPPPPGPSLWPLPANFTSGSQTISLSPQFSFHCARAAGTGGGCGAGSLVQTAFERFHQRIFAEHGGGGGGGGGGDTTVAEQQLSALTVHVGSADERETLQLGMDESYSLEIAGQATLSAPAVWGVQALAFCTTAQDLYFKLL